MVIKLLIEFLNKFSTEVDNEMQCYISIFVQQLKEYDKRKRKAYEFESKRIKELNKIYKKFRRKFKYE